MAKLEDLKRGAAVKGIRPDCLVTVVDVKWYGSAAIELTYKDPAGKSILAIGQVDDGQQKLVYVRQPFQQEPEFAVESVIYNLQELLAGGERPA